MTANPFNLPRTSFNTDVLASHGDAEAAEHALIAAAKGLPGDRSLFDDPLLTIAWLKLTQDARGRVEETVITALVSTTVAGPDLVLQAASAGCLRQLSIAGQAMLKARLTKKVNLNDLERVMRDERQRACTARSAHQAGVEGQILLKRGDETELAQTLLKQLGPHVVVVGSIIYNYEPASGCWVEVQESSWIRMLTMFPEKVGYQNKDEFKPVHMNARTMKGIIHIARALKHEPSFFDDARSGLCLRNGFCQVTAAGAQMTVHHPDQRMRVAFPGSYVPGARPLKFISFLESIFKNDEDRQQRIRFLQEFIGLVMTGSAARVGAVALFLVGLGANGKSTLIEIMTGLVPTQHVQAVNPNELQHEFARARLVNCLLNAVADLPEYEHLDCCDFKPFITGDMVAACCKHQDGFTFRPRAGHIVGCNRLPGLRDDSNGIWRRLAVLRFTRVFQQGEAITGLAQSILTAESEAITSWAIDGAVRALARGRLELPPSAVNEVSLWRDGSNVVALFVRDLSDTSLFAFVPDHRPAEWSHPVLYSIFRLWCKDNGNQPCNSTRFVENLKRLLKSVNRQGTHYFEIRLKLFQVWQDRLRADGLPYDPMGGPRSHRSI